MRLVFRLFVGLAALILLGLGGLFLDHLRSTQLIPLSGPLAVGRSQRIWSDSTIDVRSPPPGSARKLMAWIWYPTAQLDARRADYLPEPWRRAMQATTSPMLMLFLQRALTGIHSHALAHASVDCPAAGCPVLLLRGGHSALVAEYSSIAEDLASHGYVVVGVDAPYRTFVAVDADGRWISRAEQNNVEGLQGEAAVNLASNLTVAWSADLRFTVDELARLNANDPRGELTGKLDLSRVGALGHSLGGASVLEFCRADRRCKSVIDIDGAPFGPVVKEGLRVPTLLLLSDHANESGTETERIAGTLEDLFSHLDGEHRELRILQGATHFGFADDIKSPILVSALCRIGHRIDPRLQIQQTRTIINEFFARNLP